MWKNIHVVYVERGRKSFMLIG